MICRTGYLLVSQFHIRFDNVREILKLGKYGQIVPKHVKHSFNLLNSHGNLLIQINEIRGISE